MFTVFHAVVNKQYSQQPEGCYRAGVEYSDVFHIFSDEDGPRHFLWKAKLLSYLRQH